jgi:hypothetical protein
MARLAATHVADHPATDGHHTSVEELLRASLQAYLSDDIRSAFSRLRHIAELADTAEIAPTSSSAGPVRVWRLSVRVRPSFHPCGGRSRSLT